MKKGQSKVVGKEIDLRGQTLDGKWFRLRLRIVGYPGRVRLEHPTPLLVSSGRFLWELADVTLQSAKLAGDNRDAAAEFDLAPLLADAGHMLSDAAALSPRSS